MGHASLSVTCQQDKAFFQSVFPTQISGAALNETKVTVAFGGVPAHCIDMALTTPCVAHSDAIPPLFYCVYKGPSATHHLGPFRAYSRTVTKGSTELGTESLLECPVNFDELYSVLGYMNDGATVSLTLGVSYFTAPGTTNAMDIPFMGGPGGTVLTFSGLPAPPPPSPPTPPALPPQPVLPPPLAPPPPSLPSAATLGVVMASQNDAQQLVAGGSAYSARGFNHAVAQGAYWTAESLYGAGAETVYVVWLRTTCDSGEDVSSPLTAYNCQAQDVCQQVTGYTCVTQSYSCQSAGTT